MKADLKTSIGMSSIVIRGTNWVGDTVMSLPAAKEVRRIFPLARIAYWAPASTIPLLAASGIADQIIPIGIDSGPLLVRPFRIRTELAAGKFDMAILFQNAFESALTSWLAGIPARVGYPTDCRGPLLNVKVPLGKNIRLKHQVYYYLAISAFLQEHFQGKGKHEQVYPDCSVRIAETDIMKARELLVSIGLDLNRPLFCLCPGSVNSEAKRWPAESYAMLADILIDRLGGQVVFGGTLQEAGLIDGIISAMRYSSAANLAGKADLILTMAVMRICRMVISNDTGSAHLAVAASSTVLTIFGPTSAGGTAPFGPRAHIIQGVAPCTPCRHFRCPKPDHPCMRSISSEDVFSRAQEILSGRCL